MENKCIEKLNRRGIKPTAMRVLILRTMMSIPSAVSLADLEEELDTVDKSTIFRAITLFHAHHLIHCIDDGSGALKYAVCSDDCDCSMSDLHSHFYCERCHRTFCFENIHVPVVNLPDGFTVSSVNYVLKGVCPACAAREKN